MRACHPLLPFDKAPLLKLHHQEVSIVYERVGVKISYGILYPFIPDTEKEDYKFRLKPNFKKEGLSTMRYRPDVIFVPY